MQTAGGNDYQFKEQYTSASESLEEVQEEKKGQIEEAINDSTTTHAELQDKVEHCTNALHETELQLADNPTVSKQLSSHFAKSMKMLKSEGSDLAKMQAKTSASVETNIKHAEKAHGKISKLTIETKTSKKINGEYEKKKATVVKLAGKALDKLSDDKVICKQEKIEGKAANLAERAKSLATVYLQQTSQITHIKITINQLEVNNKIFDLAWKLDRKSDINLKMKIKAPLQELNKSKAELEGQLKKLQSKVLDEPTLKEINSEITKINNKISESTDQINDIVNHDNHVKTASGDLEKMLSDPELEQLISKCPPDMHASLKATLKTTINEKQQTLDKRNNEWASKRLQSKPNLEQAGNQLKELVTDTKNQLANGFKEKLHSKNRQEHLTQIANLLPGGKNAAELGEKTRRSSEILNGAPDLEQRLTDPNRELKLDFKAFYKPPPAPRDANAAKEVSLNDLVPDKIDFENLRPETHIEAIKLASLFDKWVVEGDTKSIQNFLDKTSKQENKQYFSAVLTSPYIVGNDSWLEIRDHFMQDKVYETHEREMGKLLADLKEQGVIDENGAPKFPPSKEGLEEELELQKIELELNTREYLVSEGNFLSGIEKGLKELPKLKKDLTAEEYKKLSFMDPKNGQDPIQLFHANIKKSPSLEGLLSVNNKDLRRYFDALVSSTVSTEARIRITGDLKEKLKVKGKKTDDVIAYESASAAPFQRLMRHGTLFETLFKTANKIDGLTDKKSGLVELLDNAWAFNKGQAARGNQTLKNHDNAQKAKAMQQTLEQRGK